jgi:hypothetical protein
VSDFGEADLAELLAVIRAARRAAAGRSVAPPGGKSDTESGQNAAGR